MKVDDKFITGFKDLDECLGGINKNSLIVVGGRPSMGVSSFGLSLLNHTSGNQTGCFISLHAKLEEIQRHYSPITNTTVEDYLIRYLEQPKIIDLLEKITSINTSHQVDYFIIDSLDYIGSKKLVFLSKKKTYHKIIRYLSLLAKAMNKPIFLLSGLHHKIEKLFPFHYGRLAHRENIWIIYNLIPLGVLWEIHD